MTWSGICASARGCRSRAAPAGKATGRTRIIDHPAGARRVVDGRAAWIGFLLFSVTVLAWVEVVRADAAMRMSHGSVEVSPAAAIAFVLQWGLMMTAMMLPSAAPMLLLYRRVGARSAAPGQRMIPTELFALTYVGLWLLTGLPVYAGAIAIGDLAARSTAFARAMPYAIAATLLAAGVYQLSPAKRACLRQCESPVSFLMRRWKSGYAATLRLAVMHAGYCIGCCWALMAVLVAAGAMSLPWVLAISVAVFAEKALPGGGRTARVIGAALIVAGLVVAMRPELAGALRPQRMH